MKDALKRIVDAYLMRDSIRDNILFEKVFPDAYAAILEAEKNGLITILRYHEMSEKMRAWNARTIQEEYDAAQDHPEYRHFLKGNFPDIIRPETDR